MSITRFFRYLPIAVAVTGLAGLSPASLSAQEAPGLITGRVLSMDSGYPVAGAYVRVDGTDFGV